VPTAPRRDRLSPALATLFGDSWCSPALPIQYLTRFEEPWDPQTPEQAIAELLRSERFEVEQVTGE
jgi:hypothetical protein